MPESKQQAEQPSDMSAASEQQGAEGFLERIQRRLTGKKPSKRLTSVPEADAKHLPEAPAASTLPAAPMSSPLPAAPSASTLPAASATSALPATPTASKLPATPTASKLSAAPHIPAIASAEVPEKLPATKDTGKLSAGKSAKDTGKLPAAKPRKKLSAGKSAGSKKPVKDDSVTQSASADVSEDKAAGDKSPSSLEKGNTKKAAQQSSARKRPAKKPPISSEKLDNASSATEQSDQVDGRSDSATDWAAVVEQAAVTVEKTLSAANRAVLGNDRPASNAGSGVSGDGGAPASKSSGRRPRRRTQKTQASTSTQQGALEQQDPSAQQGVAIQQSASTQQSASIQQGALEQQGVAAQAQPDSPSRPNLEPSDQMAQADQVSQPDQPSRQGQNSQKKKQQKKSKDKSANGAAARAATSQPPAPQPSQQPKQPQPQPQPQQTSQLQQPKPQSQPQQQSKPQQPPYQPQQSKQQPQSQPQSQAQPQQLQPQKQKSGQQSGRRVLTEVEQQQIYQIIADSFDFDQPIPMATVSSVLLNAGIDKKKYGFKQYKDLFAALGKYVVVNQELRSGTPQSFVTVRQSGGYIPAIDIDKPKEEALGEPGLYKKKTRPAMLQPISVPMTVRAELGQTLSEFAYMNPRIIQIIRHSAPDGEDIPTALCEDYADALRSSRLSYRDGKVMFPLRYKRDDGRPIYAAIRKQDTPGREYPWYLCYADVESIRKAPLTEENFHNRLKAFAWIPDWKAFLSRLAAMALPEPWDFKGSKQPRLTILDSYIRHTFLHLELEDKIAYSDDGSFAAWNTGLVDKSYSPIYACFAPSSPDADEARADAQTPAQTWTFLDFCVAGMGTCGKALVDRLNEFPEKAAYFAALDELVFDCGKELFSNYQHIIIDNIDRIPLDVIGQEMSNDPVAQKLVERIRQTPTKRARKPLYSQLGMEVQSDDWAFRRLQHRIEDAADIAVKQISWDYKIAIPSYYPRNNSMAFLLPLSIAGNYHIDAVLVAELKQSGNYQGQTVLTPQMAYNHARLLSRPDSPWLLHALEAEGEEEDEEDED